MEFVKEILFAIIAASVPVATTFLCKWLVSLSEANKVKIKNEKAQATSSTTRISTPVIQLYLHNFHKFLPE